MKIKSLVLMLGLVTALTESLAKTAFAEKDILGVWGLTKFVISDKVEKEWCTGATGSIVYIPGYMSVSINCETTEKGSGAEKIGGLLFYSGPFDVDTQTGEVIHRVRNYSHPSLNKVYRRKIEMKNENSLRLVGSLGKGKEAIVEWERQESFAYDSKPLSGIWELVGSENEIEGSKEKVPFCTGFYGTILYTPGGYNSVSINCGRKINKKVKEPADQFERRFFYSGSYKIEGPTVVQTPDNASEVQLIGKPAARSMVISGDVLTLTGTNGSKFTAKWRKLKSFVGLEKSEN